MRFLLLLLPVLAWAGNDTLTGTSDATEWFGLSSGDHVYIVSGSFDSGSCDVQFRGEDGGAYVIVTLTDDTIDNTGIISVGEKGGSGRISCYDALTSMSVYAEIR